MLFKVRFVIGLSLRSLFTFRPQRAKLQERKDMAQFKKLDVEEPLWDQSTFIGRLKHFIWVTDPRTCVAAEETLDQAKELIEHCRLGKELPGTTEEQIIYAKKLYESSFHPDTHEKQNVFGRMSFQVPGGMAVTGAMLQFYRTLPAVVFWQWVNQSFNALVNYTNRNANSPTTPTQITVAYISATAAALITAIGCKSYWQRVSGPFMQRYVPFAAVAASNCVNIPLMRQNEILYGVDVYDDNDNKVGESRVAAVKGISQVVLCRIIMCAPGMTILPFLMEKLETYNWMQRIKLLHAPFQVMLVGCFLVFMVPTACALFPQKCKLKMNTLALLESSQYKKIKNNCMGELPHYVFFNKGL